MKTKIMNQIIIPNGLKFFEVDWEFFFPDLGMNKTLMFFHFHEVCRTNIEKQYNFGKVNSKKLKARIIQIQCQRSAFKS